MGIARWRLVGALCAAAFSIGWAPETELAIARRGVLLGPPDLARQVRRHHRSFVDGLAAPVRDYGADGLDPLIAEREALALTGRIVEKIDGHVPFEEIVGDVGTLVHWILVTGDPILNSRDSRVASYARDYHSYVERLHGRLPRVYYGIHPRSLDGSGVAEILRTARARAGRLSRFVGDEYYRGGPLRRSESFDDLAVTYGVASICTSRSVSDVASVLTAVWSRVHGDLRPVAPAADAEGEYRVVTRLPSLEPSRRSR